MARRSDPPAMVVLALRALDKAWRAGTAECAGAVRALGGIDLDLHAGEIVGVLGGAGAGKTTLLLCAAGLARPDAGSVAWFGVPARPGVPRPPGIVFVPERPVHYAALTVQEMLGYHALLHELPMVEHRRRVAESLERSALVAQAGTRIGALGTGERRRLALARALVLQPRLLLLDELLTGLAPGDPGTDALGAALRDVASAGCAVLLTARELAPLRGVASRVIGLREGRLYGAVAPTAAVDPTRRVAEMLGVLARGGARP